MVEMTMLKPQYLGDGVYGMWDPSTGSLVLRTGSHLNAQFEDEVVIEPQVWTSLVAYVAAKQRGTPWATPEQVAASPLLEASGGH